MEIDLLQIFKSHCRNAFAFLREFNFVEKDLPKEKKKSFRVVFTNGQIEIEIRGDGYGRSASILFITKNNEEVYYQELDKNFEPRLKKIRKGKRENNLDQEDQISLAAKIIENDYKELLQGNYSRLDEVADKNKQRREKQKLAHQKFLQDPIAQAKHAKTCAVAEAGHALKRKDYRKFVTLLEPYEEYLTESEIRKYHFAKQELGI